MTITQEVILEWSQTVRDHTEDAISYLPSYIQEWTVPVQDALLRVLHVVDTYSSNIAKIAALVQYISVIGLFNNSGEGGLAECPPEFACVQNDCGAVAIALATV